MNRDTEINKLIEMTYPRLQAYTWTLLKDKNRLHLDPDDLIQTAFILLWEKGVQFNFENMRRPIYDAMVQYTYNKSPSLTAALMNEETKFCKKCEDTMPVAMFYKKKIYPNGLIVYHTECKTCYGLKQEAKRQEKLADPVLRAIHNEKKRIYQNARNAMIQSNEKLHSFFKEKHRNKYGLKVS